MIARYPDPDGTPQGTGDIFSEIWYAYNPDYLYGAQIQAKIDPKATSSSVTVISSTQVVISAVSGSFAVGDEITGNTGVAVGTKITGITGSGTLTLTLDPNTPLTGSPTSVSTPGDKILVVNTVYTPATNDGIKIGQTVSGSGVPAGTEIHSFGTGAGGTGRYYLSMTTPTNVALRDMTTGAKSVGNEIYLTNASSLPAQNTILQVRSGSGVFSTTSRVIVNTVDAPNKRITVSTPSAPGTAIPPATTLAGAQICGGTCAFFNNPGSTTSTTEYQLSRTGGVDQWSSGFLCLSGVDNAKTSPVRDVTGLTPARWTEVVQ